MTIAIPFPLKIALAVSFIVLVILIIDSFKKTDIDEAISDSASEALTARTNYFGTPPLLKLGVAKQLLSSSSSQSSSSSTSLVVLMTATIFPSLNHVKISKEETRVEQYFKSLQFWCGYGIPIVFVENSNAVNESYALRDRSRCADRVEVILTPPSALANATNYGTLEAMAIREALQRTKHQSSDIYFIKVTGRITIPNFQEIVNSLECTKFQPAPLPPAGGNASTHNTVATAIAGTGAGAGCPKAYVNPYVLPPPHSQRPFIDTTFMIFTARTYLDLLSVDEALPKFLGYPIERTLADHLLDHCKAGFDVKLMRARCAISFLGCVRRHGRVGWSGGSYADDADCTFNNAHDEEEKKKQGNHQSRRPHSLGNIPPVVFLDYGLVARPPSMIALRSASSSSSSSISTNIKCTRKRDSNSNSNGNSGSNGGSRAGDMHMAVLGIFEANEGKTTLKGLKRFLSTIDDHSEKRGGVSVNNSDINKSSSSNSDSKRNHIDRRNISSVDSDSYRADDTSCVSVDAFIFSRARKYSAEVDTLIRTYDRKISSSSASRSSTPGVAQSPSRRSLREAEKLLSGSRSSLSLSSDTTTTTTPATKQKSAETETGTGRRRLSEADKVVRHRYVLFHGTPSKMAPAEHAEGWEGDGLLIGGAPKIFFLRFVLYRFAIAHCIHHQYTHFLLTDVNDVYFQSPFHLRTGPLFESSVAISKGKKQTQSQTQTSAGVTRVDSYSSALSEAKQESVNAVPRAESATSTGPAATAATSSPASTSSSFLVPAFEFARWDSPLVEAQINRMWLSDCLKVYYEKTEGSGSSGGGSGGDTLSRTLDPTTRQMFEGLRGSLLSVWRGMHTKGGVKCGMSREKGAMPWSDCGPEMFSGYTPQQNHNNTSNSLSSAGSSSSSQLSSRSSTAEPARIADQLGLRFRHASCAGTIAGSREGISSYLSHYESMYRSDFLCNDQGVHNIILNYAPVDALLVSEPDSGPILTFDHADMEKLETAVTVVRTPAAGGGGGAGAVTATHIATRSNESIAISESKHLEICGRQSSLPFSAVHQYNRCSAQNTQNESRICSVANGEYNS